MSDVDLQKLISLKRRRLQKLKEQEAIFGINTPPEILIEIKDLEMELAQLEAELHALGPKIYFAELAGETRSEATLGETSTKDVNNLKQRPQPEAYATARIVDHQPDQDFYIGNAYVLQAGIRSEMAEGFETASILLPSTEETIQFEIVVHAEGMAVQPALVQSFTFNRSQEMPLLEFELRPHDPGRKQIRVEFFYQRHWLAHINFEVKVVPAPESVPA